MLETEMEDLIAAYPDEFFPRYGFVLRGRQQSFQGVGRFDLLFTDRHGVNILMELKAVAARYDVIAQLARYRDALIERGSSNILMWIVAPSVPPSMKEFLSHLGIEFTEIRDLEFKRVAASFDYVVRDSKPENPKAPSNGTLKTFPGVSSGPLSDVPPNTDAVVGVDEWGFGYGTQPSFLLRALEAGGKTREQIRSEFISHFYPGLSYSDAKSKSGFNVFFSDSKRPLGTYHASRSLLIREDSSGCLSLDGARVRIVKSAIAGGILSKLRGLSSKRDKRQIDEILGAFGLPSEPKPKPNDSEG